MQSILDFCLTHHKSQDIKHKESLFLPPCLGCKKLIWSFFCFPRFTPKETLQWEVKEIGKSVHFAYHSRIFHRPLFGPCNSLDKATFERLGKSVPFYLGLIHWFIGRKKRLRRERIVFFSSFFPLHTTCPFHFFSLKSMTRRRRHRVCPYKTLLTYSPSSQEEMKCTLIATIKSSKKVGIKIKSNIWPKDL